MNDTQRFEWLRSEYRHLWDAHQVLAYKNAALLHQGRRPSRDQIADEERAAVAVEQVRNELAAAISRLDHHAASPAPVIGWTARRPTPPARSAP